VRRGRERARTVEGTVPSVPQTRTGFGYWREPSEQRTGPSVQSLAASGATTADYVVPRFYGEGDNGGTATVWDAGTTTFIRVEPDGRLVRAQVYGVNEDGILVAPPELDGSATPRSITEEAWARTATGGWPSRPTGPMWRSSSPAEPALSR
jgi:hypothetical protein